MSARVHTLIFNIRGQRSLALPPRAMRKLEDYVADAAAYGLADQEIAGDLVRLWPSDRREIEVTTQHDGEVWVSITPARSSPPARRPVAGAASRPGLLAELRLDNLPQRS